jgi:uncharacterized protein YjfI (DUF2170 family)
MGITPALNNGHNTCTEYPIYSNVKKNDMIVSLLLWAITNSSDPTWLSFIYFLLQDKILPKRKDTNNDTKPYTEN